MNCSGCGSHIDAVTHTYYEEVTGWLKKRRQGGANSVTKRCPTGRYSCRSCIEGREEIPGQLSLDDMV